MPAFTFTLVLAGAAKPSEKLEDALFNAGMDDALVGFRDGVPFIDFDREAPSLLEALVAAIQAVESAGLGLHVVRVEPDEFVNAADIADWISRTARACDC